MNVNTFLKVLVKVPWSAVRTVVEQEYIRTEISPLDKKICGSQTKTIHPCYYPVKRELNSFPGIILSQAGSSDE